MAAASTEVGSDHIGARFERARSAVTFTSYDLISQCEAAGAYTLVGGQKERPTFPMWRGIFVHRFLEYCQTRGREEALEYVRPKMRGGLIKLCSAIDVDALPQGRAELGLAFCPETGTGREQRRGLWDVDAETEHGIKLDLVSEKDGCPWVIDYKTGDVSKLNPWTEPQLLGGMLSLRATLRADPWGIVSGALPPHYFVSFAGILGNGSVQWRTAQLDAETLDKFEARSRQIHLKVLSSRRKVDHGEPISFTTGPQCNGCALASACPELAAKALQAGAGCVDRDDL